MAVQTSPKRTGASLARHRSEQSVQTPVNFMRAVVRRFGPISFDLAASSKNRQAPGFYSVSDNALIQDWTPLTGNLWLNPPFGTINRWAGKCSESAEGPHAFDRILFLVPASVGSGWFRDHVHQRALVLPLNGRLHFVGHSTPYPKDLMLCSFGRFEAKTIDVWDWRPAAIEAHP